jgi:hypothetical protein
MNIAVSTPLIMGANLSPPRTGSKRGDRFSGVIDQQANVNNDAPA